MDKTYAERETLKQEAETKQEQLREMNKKIQDLQRQINESKSRNVEPVTEHAILRYLERVKGIDIEAIKKEIMEHALSVLGGSGEVKGTIDGHKYRIIVKNKQVITISPVKKSLTK